MPYKDPEKQRAYHRKRYLENKVKMREQNREYMRKYYQNNKVKCREYVYKWRAKNKAKYNKYQREYKKEYMREYMKEYLKRHPNVIKAQSKANYYISLEDVNCSWGGCNEQATDRHHPDYNESLNITPFCHKHHIIIHRLYSLN